MIALLYTAVFVAAVFAAAAWMVVSRHERHDRIVLSFEQIRRDLLDVTLAPRGEFSPREDAAARFLLATVNGVTFHYHSHKTELFNLRAIRRAIESDLQRYRETQEMVRERLADLPDSPKIRKAYVGFAVATTDAFVANTPFIREEIVLRLALLFWRDLAEQIASARREGDMVRHEFEGKLA